MNLLSLKHPSKDQSCARVDEFPGFHLLIAWLSTQRQRLTWYAWVTKHFQTCLREIQTSENLKTTTTEAYDLL